MSSTPSQGSSDQVGKHTIEFREVGFELAAAADSKTQLMQFGSYPAQSPHSTSVLNSPKSVARVSDGDEGYG